MQHSRSWYPLTSMPLSTSSCSHSSETKGRRCIFLVSLLYIPPLLQAISLSTHDVAEEQTTSTMSLRADVQLFQKLSKAVIRPLLGVPI